MIMFNEKNLVRKTVNESIDTKTLPFMSLKDFIGRDIRVWGYFFTNGKYGEQVVVVGEGVLINLPKRYTEIFKGWSNEEVEAIKNGNMVLKNIRVIDTNNGTTVTFDYADYVG